jgi:hypothetical protein
MRSRDGDSTFSRTIRKIISLCLLSSALLADEYLISYRYVVKDALLYNEQLNISRAMKKCSGEPTNETLILMDNNQTLYQLLQSNANSFNSFISKLGLNVSHISDTYNMKNHSTTIITLKTRCFKVDFNDTFVKITPLK